MSTLNIMLAAVALLWAYTIGPEELPAEPSRPVDVPSQTVKKKVPTSTWDRQPIQLATKAAVDQATFLREFKRQAQVVGLFECLRNYRPSPESLLVAANLKKGGALEHLRVAATNQQLPACAQTAIGSMRFPESVRTLPGDDHTIIWRLDW